VFYASDLCGHRNQAGYASGRRCPEINLMMDRLG